MTAGRVFSSLRNPPIELKHCFCVPVHMKTLAFHFTAHSITDSIQDIGTPVAAEASLFSFQSSQCLLLCLSVHAKSMLCAPVPIGSITKQVGGNSSGLFCREEAMQRCK